MNTRIHLTIKGAVQGVGFRPYIYRLATELNLAGWVNNSTQGVFIELEGNAENLQIFLDRLPKEKPIHSIIQSLEITWLEAIGYKNFTIKPSINGDKTAIILPEIATCPDCLQDIFDPQNRRYQYPFTNCTNCGPRYTIIEALPYDRCQTTMKQFSMCFLCQSEYNNPLDRRFHAQPNACPQCGPHLELWHKKGQVLDRHHQALLSTVKAIRQGKIVAVKGLGGFHLMVDANNKNAIEILRQRKHRPHKPLAVMYPSLETIQEDCFVSELEKQLLQASEAPIVLLKRKNKKINDNIAPNNPYLGVILPYTPLHHLLLSELQTPVIATSGNLADEPICIDEHQALTKLSVIADLFLVHNRPILRPVDDSIVRVMMEKTTILRRARGYAPLPIFTAELPNYNPNFILAVGGYLKNTIALYFHQQILLSQHIGDLENSQTLQSFLEVIASFKKLYDFQANLIVCDKHPDYLSSQYAENSGINFISVQHHYAHILACMTEHNLLQETVLGIAWDGTGYGEDHTIWGGEFLLVNTLTKTKENQPFQRIAHLETFPLLSGSQAIKFPRRIALGLLYQIFGSELFTNTPEICQNFIRQFPVSELKILQQMLAKNINCSLTSSIGRLFDGVAAILNLCEQITFEGQAAMQLEFILDPNILEETYPFELKIKANSPIIINWQPILLNILQEISLNITPAIISAKFHNTLVEIIITIANKIGCQNIVLTGGCFQNKYLLEKAIQRLQITNFSPYWHQNIPTNDGGIAVGQIIAALSIDN